jgi:hypothetical protein
LHATVRHVDVNIWSQLELAGERLFLRQQGKAVDWKTLTAVNEPGAQVEAMAVDYAVVIGPGDIRALLDALDGALGDDDSVLGENAIRIDVYDIGVYC